MMLENINSALQKYHNGHYEDILTNAYSNTVADANAITCNDRDRDRFAVLDTDHSTDSASLQHTKNFGECKRCNNIQLEGALEGAKIDVEGAQPDTQLYNAPSIAYDLFALIKKYIV